MTVMWKILYTLFKAVLIAILSVYLVSVFDIAAHFSFVPEQRTFVVSNSIYLAILVGAFSIFEEVYNYNCLKYDLYFSPDTDKRTEKDTPTVILQDGQSKVGFLRVYLDISITGKEKDLRKNKVVILYPEAITIQPDVSQQGFVSVDSDKRKCEIDVAKLVNEGSKLPTTNNCKVILSILQKQSFAGTDKILNVDVECKNLLRKWFFLKKKSNQLKIKIKG